MKPQFIKRETAKRIKEGYWDDLMGTIEEGFDLYGEKQFDRGYNACVDDLDVFAERLAQCIFKVDMKRDVGYNIETLTNTIHTFIYENIKTKE